MINHFPRISVLRWS